MSWAEVTKINSDLSVPLNELIEDKTDEMSNKGNLKFFKAYYTSSLTTETTILDVQGSGFLYNVKVTNHYGYSSTYPAIFRVAIDGEYIINIEKTSGTKGFTMATYPFVCNTSNITPVMNLEIADIDLYYTASNIDTTYSVELPFEATSMSTMKYTNLLQPLKFSESLTISVAHYYDSSNSNTRAYYGCLYTLLD